MTAPIDSRWAQPRGRITPMSCADETLVSTTRASKLTRRSLGAIRGAISKGRVRSRVRRDGRGGVVPGAAAMSESKPVGRMAPRIGVTEPSTAPDRSVTASRGLWTMIKTPICYPTHSWTPPRSSFSSPSSCPAASSCRQRTLDGRGRDHVNAMDRVHRPRRAGGCEFCSGRTSGSQSEVETGGKISDDPAGDESPVRPEMTTSVKKSTSPKANGAGGDLRPGVDRRTGPRLVDSDPDREGRTLRRGRAGMPSVYMWMEESRAGSQPAGSGPADGRLSGRDDGRRDRREDRPLWPEPPSRRIVIGELEDLGIKFVAITEHLDNTPEGACSATSSVDRRVGT